MDNRDRMLRITNGKELQNIVGKEVVDFKLSHDNENLILLFGDESTLEIDSGVFSIQIVYTDKAVLNE